MDTSQEERPAKFIDTRTPCNLLLTTWEKEQLPGLLINYSWKEIYYPQSERTDIEEVNFIMSQTGKQNYEDL